MLVKILFGNAHLANLETTEAVLETDQRLAH